MGKIVPMSQHKYASNVVEKCLEYGGSDERECLIEEILMQTDESDNLLVRESIPIVSRIDSIVLINVVRLGNDEGPVCKLCSPEDN